MKPRYKAHYGGKCPVGNDVIVDAFFKDGVVIQGFRAGDFGGAGGCQDWWKHEGHSKNHIIAYRVVTDD